MNLRIFESLEDLSRAAARTIRQRKPAVIGVSGGSTPKRLYELLAGEFDRDVICVLIDERYVPLDDPQSNSAMIRASLRPETFLDFDTTAGDPEHAALDFEKRWRARGLSSLDIAILGAGDDGHTASLFPGTAVLDVEDRIAAAVYVPRLQQWRVTVTMPVIRAAKLRMVLADGQSKAAIVREVGAGVDHPVRRATTSPVGETWWFVTRSAAPRSDRGAPL